MNMLDKVLDLIIPRKCAGCGKPSEVFCDICFSASNSDRTACLLCGQRNLAGEVCQACRRNSKTPLQNVLWAGRYDDELKKAVWALKYGKRKEMAKPLGAMLAKKFLKFYGGSLPAQQIARHGAKQKVSVLGDLAQRDGARRAIRQQADMRINQNGAPFAAVPIPLHFKKEYERGFNQAELLAREFCKNTGIPLLTDVLQKNRETEEQVKVQDKELRLKNLEDAFEFRNGGRITSWPTLILIDDVATSGATLTHAAIALKSAGAKDIIGLVVAHGA